MTWIKLYLVIVSALISVSILKVVFKTIVANVIKEMNRHLPATPSRVKPDIIGTKKTVYDDGTGK